MATLNNRIAETRKELGLTQAAFSKKLKVSRSYLSEVENSKGKPSIEMLVGIATVFRDVDLRWLLTGDESQQEISKGLNNVDLKTLSLCLEAIEWAFEEAGKTNIDPRKKIDLLMATYDFCKNTGGNVDKQSLVKLVRLAA